MTYFSLSFKAFVCKFYYCKAENKTLKNQINFFAKYALFFFFFPVERDLLLKVTAMKHYQITL